MNERQQALMGYVATIARDPRVREAYEKSQTVGQFAAQLGVVVAACMREDIRTVAEEVARRGGAAFLQMARPLVSSVAGQAVDEAIGWLFGKERTR